jgi:hypothetical protein
VLDVTEERDLLPLTGCEHAVSGKSIDEPGQPLALPGSPDPHDQQAIIRCVTLELRPGSTRLSRAGVCLPVVVDVAGMPGAPRS